MADHRTDYRSPRTDAEEKILTSVLLVLTVLPVLLKAEDVFDSRH